MFSNSAGTVSRRRALVIASLAAAGAVTVVLRPAGSDNGSSANADVTVAEYDDAGRKLRPATRKKVTARVTYPDGRTMDMPLVARIDTVDEFAYFKSGGILQHVLRNLLAA